jgi:anti-sigma B factor antagonist
MIRAGRSSEAGPEPVSVLTVHNQPGPAGTVVVALPTELDIANSEQIRRLLAEALRPGVRVLVADLTRTVFRDASGLRALLRSRNRAADAHAEFWLVVPPGRVRRVLDVLGLGGQLRIFPSVSHALAAAGRDDHDRPELADRV